MVLRRGGGGVSFILHIEKWLFQLVFHIDTKPGGFLHHNTFVTTKSYFIWPFY